jgi:hypothetical protein
MSNDLEGRLITLRNPTFKFSQGKNPMNSRQINPIDSVLYGVTSSLKKTSIEIDMPRIKKLYKSNLPN